MVPRLSDERVKIASMPDFKKFCRTPSLRVDIADANAFRANTPNELEQWQKVIELSKKA